MKSGKTTAAASFPKSLLLAFEKGYNAIGGIVAQDITKWADVKLVLRQLERPEVRDRFDTIIFDTASIAWDYVESFVCSQNGVTKISDIAWGAGYAQCKKEFESTLRKITLLGYGVVLLAHSVSRIEKRADGSEVEIISPDLPKRAAEICNSLKVSDKPFEVAKAEEKLDFNALMSEAREIWTTKVNNAQTDEDKEAVVRTMSKKVEMVFGRKLKLSEVTEDQVSLLQLAVMDLRAM